MAPTSNTRALPLAAHELNLIEAGKNYGWPLVSYATNYNGVPIPSPDTPAHIAMARPRSSRGKTLAITDRVEGMMSAPPTPLL